MVIEDLHVDQKRVADAATAHYYLEALYERDCVAVVGPDSCMIAQRALNVLRWEAQACAAAVSQGKGHLPKIARKRLKAAMAAVEVP